jgi:hypothetical protein
VLRGISVHASRDGGSQLLLAFDLAGDIAALAIPAPATPGFRDELWRHTCCEAFIAGGESEAYTEFNFSPSGEWAAYRFDAPRQGMQPLHGQPSPQVAVELAQDCLRLRARVDLAALGISSEARLRVGLSAVVESASGTHEYWALAHPAERPDFHHPQSFTLTL